MPYEFVKSKNLKPSLNPKVECPCGENVLRRNYSTHCVSKSHISFMCMNGATINRIKIKANNNN
jgi:hypothetical protein